MEVPLRKFASSMIAAVWVLVLVTVLAADRAHAGSAPDPGGDEGASLELPPDGRTFGFNVIPAELALEPTTQASLMERAGANAARVPLEWWGVEGKRDVWNEVVWLRHATTYATLRAAGIRPHFVLAKAPQWARDPGDPQSCTDRSWCNYPPARSQLAEWREFVAEVVRRFPQATIEIWNEPNSGGQWRSGVDPERYAELVAAADSAAAAVEPGTPLMMGGLASSVGSGSLPLRDYLDRAYAATPSLKGHTDAINFHVYPSGRLAAGSPFAQLFADVRAVRAAHGDDATPLFLSETGASTTGSDAMSEAEQSDALLRTLRRVMSMPDVDGALVHTLIDRLAYAEDDPERGLGVLNAEPLPDLEPKRAYCQLTRLARSLYPLCPPLAVIEDGPQGPHPSSAPEFRFSSTEVAASFECSMDGAAFTACASPARYAGLSEGDHTFAVRALDSLGRFDRDPIERSFHVDTVAPETTLAGPAGPIRDDTPTFFPETGDAESRIECSLNGAQYAPCSSPHALGPLQDGQYTLRARAADPAGNRDATPATRDFRVDTRAPVATITSGPQGATAVTRPRFEFTSDEPGSTFVCAFNGVQPLGPCREPNAHTTAGDLGDGSYSFQVVAIDAAGNRSSTASRSFQVDRTGPATTIQVPASPTNDSTPTFGLGAGEAGVTFECRFDDAQFAPCPAQVVSPVLADGDHAIEARGIDRLGNRGPVTRKGIRIDTRPPEARFVSAPPLLVAITSVVFEFGADEAGARLQCSLDGASFSACTSPLSLGGLRDGAHGLRVRAADPAGNVDPTPVERTFTVDTRGPTSSVTLGPTGSTQQQQPTFAFTVDEPGSTVECRFDQAPWGPCSAPSSHRPASLLAEGEHAFEIRARDRAGNLGAVARRTFAVDRTAPSVPSVSVTNALDREWLAGTRGAFSVAPSEPGLRWECSVDGAGFTPCAADFERTGLTEGRHALYVRAFDGASNASKLGVVSFTVDFTAPDTTISRGSPVRRGIQVLVDATETATRFECSLDGRAYRACEPPHTYKRLKPGRHVVEAAAIDRAGNRDSSSARLRFRVRRR